MAWKQDLAKLKQQLGPEEQAKPAPKPPPKTAPKPQGPTSLDDEDAVFLSAMGLKAKAPGPGKAVPEPPAPPSEAPVATPPPPPETFEEALKDLKGLKPLARGPMAQAPPPASAPLTPAPQANPVQAPPPPAKEKGSRPLPPEAPKAAGEAAPADQAEPAPAPPMRFQLAAGMAIDVDGVLDLRGHTLQDAMERLKDRLEDGLVLGWRSLQVILGPEPALHEGLLTLLASGEAPMVARFAQAPVPMGGSQAWLLYFTPSQPQS